MKGHSCSRRLNIVFVMEEVRRVVAIFDSDKPLIGGWGVDGPYTLFPLILEKVAIGACSIGTQRLPCTFHRPAFAFDLRCPRPGIAPGMEHDLFVSVRKGCCITRYAAGEVEYLADALLAQLDVDLYIFQRDVRGYSSERIRSGLSYLLESIEIASATKRRTEKNEL